MPKKLCSAVGGLALAAFATPGLAAKVPSLEVIVFEGACGGSVGCVTTIDTPISPATDTDVADAAAANSLPDGSYASAHATAQFGALHVSSTAFRATGSDAQSDAIARSVDFIPASAIVGGAYTASFIATGSHSAQSLGNSSGGFFDWQYYDVSSGVEIDHGQWFSTDAMPETTVTDTFAVPTGDGLELHVEFEAFTYSSYGVVDTADYSDTLTYYLASAAPGPDLIGLSGHSYSAPAMSAAPEPTTWALMIVGFGIVGSAVRRRRVTPATRPS